jgi:hypothetical protein
MENTPSPIETLRQLREMLDAGTITPAEFEALKQTLVFPGAPPAAPTAPVPTPAPAVAEELHSPTFEEVEAEVPRNDFAASALAPLPAVAVPPLPAMPNELAPINELESFEDPPARNPLNLILSIGGLLVLLSLVLYLSLNNRSSEHIGSTSQTAADSLGTTIEEGPQAEQIELPAAVPETVRVAPVTPAPPIVKPTVPPAAPDSLKTPLPAAAPDSSKK